MLYDRNGNPITANEVEANKEEPQEEPQEQVQSEVEITGAEKLLDQYSKFMRSSIEANLNRAKISNIQLNQSQYMEIVGIINRIYLYRVMEFLSDKIGIDDFSAVIDDDIKSDIDGSIKFEQNLAPTPEEIEKFSKKQPTDKK